MDTPPTAAVELIADRYGKARVRLLTIRRDGVRHEMRELTFRILCEGEFESSYTAGDNSQVLPTDTMKNTVYALAKKHGVHTIEDFAHLLADHFLSNNAQIRQVRVKVVEHLWTRIEVAGKPHDSAWVRGGPEQRTARLTATRDACTVRAGIDDLLVLKSSGSSFAGFLRDEYTTLKDAGDRVLATSMKVVWRYGATGVEYDECWAGVHRTILETFARHDSKSVQHTLHAIGKAVLAGFPTIEEIHITMPNKHCLLVDLQRFGMQNDGEIFVPTDEPHGYIEARLGRAQRVS